MSLIEEPTWLRPLAIAVLEQALADSIKDEFWAGVQEWMRQGGQLGESEWSVAGILQVDAEAMLAAAERLRRRELRDIPPVKDWLRRVLEESDAE